MNLGVIFGGKSTEHDVSIVSGLSIIKNINKQKYNIIPIYIDEEGEWFEPLLELENVKIGTKIIKGKKIENIIEYLKKLDVVFPVLHGKNGEDGTIQGLFEIVQVPYVGCGVLSSSIGMDKAYTKIVFEKANLKQLPYIYLKKRQNGYTIFNNDKILNLEEVEDIVSKKLKYPVFVKPSNAGSSIGISKVKDKTKLEEAISIATQYDKKIIIEQGVNAREIECAVLGNDDAIASCVGEIIPADEFYSFDAKYHNAESICIIPAKIEKEQQETIRKMAIKAFKAIDGSGLARVDFFIENNTNEIYINEINTLPGFTDISMYSKLWQESGIKYSELIERLVNLAIEK